MIVSTQIIEKIREIDNNKSNKSVFIQQLKIIGKKIIKKLKDRIIIEAQYNLLRKIKKAIQKRQLNFNDNISSVIKSLKRGPLEINKILDRIKIQKDNNIEIYIDPYSVNKLATEYFEKHFKSKDIAINVLSADLLKIYEIKELDKNSKEYLMKPISLEEITEAIKQAPNKKATGYSNISYEILKYLGPIALENITNLFNYLLEQNKIPPSWKLGIIIPILKKLEVHGEIESYRPITLLESTRKIFTRIIIKRLYKIIIENNLLNGINVGFMPSKRATNVGFII